MPDLYGFTMKAIDGTDRRLADYRGQVLLLVNVASQCGLTPQYETLQKLHAEYASRGFAVLGFPCNQFGGQEPGTDADVKQFCTTSYGVTFPLFSKIEVNGQGRAPLYAWLGDRYLVPQWGGAIVYAQAAKLALFIAILVWIRHAGNIRRLLSGTEPKIGRKKAEGA